VGTKGSTKNGVKVGGETSALVTKLDEAVKAGNKTKNKEYFDNLTDTSKFKDTAARSSKIKGGSGLYRNPKFRSNFFDLLASQGIKVSDQAKKLLSIHHVVPNALRQGDLGKFIKDNMKYNIDDVINAMALPTIDLKKLNAMLSKVDDLSKSGKDAKKQLDALRKEFGLADDISLDGIKSVRKELETLADASVHNGYHSRYSSFVSEKLYETMKKFDDLVDDIGEIAAKNNIKPEFDEFIGSLFYKLKTGEFGTDFMK